MAEGDAHITYREDVEKWAVDVEGAAGAASRHDKRVRAEGAAQAQAEENGADLIVHEKDGSVVERRRHRLAQRVSPARRRSSVFAILRRRVSSRLASTIQSAYSLRWA